MSHLCTLDQCKARIDRRPGVGALLGSRDSFVSSLAFHFLLHLFFFFCIIFFAYHPFFVFSSSFTCRFCPSKGGEEKETAQQPIPLAKTCGGAQCAISFFFPMCSVPSITTLFRPKVRPSRLLRLSCPVWTSLAKEAPSEPLRLASCSYWRRRSSGLLEMQKERTQKEIRKKTIQAQFFNTDTKKATGSLRVYGTNAQYRNRLCIIRHGHLHRIRSPDAAQLYMIQVLFPHTAKSCKPSRI